MSTPKVREWKKSEHTEKGNESGTHTQWREGNERKITVEKGKEWKKKKKFEHRKEENRRKLTRIKTK